MATLVAIFLRLKYKPLMSSETKSRRFIEQKRTMPNKKVTFKSSKIVVKEESFNNDQLFVLGRNNNEIILYFHGGAYVKNITRSHFKMLEKICLLTGRQIYVPIYKKAPQYCYKDALKDMSELYQSLLKEKKDIIFMGDSSGGGFIYSLCLYLNDREIKLPSRLVALSPWVDVSMDKQTYINEKDDSMEGSKGAKVFGEYWSKGGVKSPYVSPTYGDLSNMPESLIVVGGKEILLEDIIEFTEKLVDAHNKVTLIRQDYMGHVYPAYPIKEGKIALKQIEHFIVKENKDE